MKYADKTRQYIMDWFDPDGFPHAPRPKGEDGKYTLDQFPAVAKFIMDVFHTEKYFQLGSDKMLFTEWTQGLPSVLNCKYYVDRSAFEDLVKVRGYAMQYDDPDTTERLAEKALTEIIYEELKRGCS